MTERNKTDLLLFAKLGVLVVWGILTIITFAGVLNYCPETFVKWCAGILLVCNGFIFWRFAKRLTDERNAKIKEIQDKERAALVAEAKKMEE